MTFCFGPFKVFTVAALCAQITLSFAHNTESPLRLNRYLDRYFYLKLNSKTSNPQMKTAEPRDKYSIEYLWNIGANLKW